MKNKILIVAALISFITLLSIIYPLNWGKQYVYLKKPSEKNLNYVSYDKNPLDKIKASLKTLPNGSSKLTDFKIVLDAKESFKNEEIYVLNNRYFIPLAKFFNFLSAKYSVRNKDIIVSGKSKEILINAQDMTFSADNKAVIMSKPLYSLNNDIYINLFDACNIFNLKTKWDFSNNRLFLFANPETSVKKAIQNASLKPALIRLEDVAPNPGQCPEELEKLRVIADFLYNEDIKFHVAWIPRYINPKLSIDNEPASAYSIFNADFVFTLDYMMNKNGIMGLHGYTHQYGDFASIDGIEFHTTYKKDNIPDTEEYAQERLTNAINSAKKLDIPYHFFEAPHYAATPKQFKVMEKFFDILYEPYSPDGLNEINTKIYTVNNGDKTTSYIPTPLNYLDGKKDLDNMLARIMELKEGNLASFFYHSYLEYEFIELKETQYGYSKYVYSENSCLHRIIEALRNQGFGFKSVNELIK